MTDNSVYQLGGKSDGCLQKMADNNVSVGWQKLMAVSKK
jgi:hypothetical protein